MDRIFWVECPACRGRFYCDYEMRHAGIDLICPYCGKSFPVESSPWIDDRG
jgi:uncharacterized protein YbaR (Trm112 family)